MKGTLALWHEAAAAGHENGAETPSKAVPVELHLNLWRDLPSGVNFLDVGMLFPEPQSLNRFYLYVPAVLERAQLFDLSGILQSAANAVFNDVVQFGSAADGRYTILRSGAPDTVFEIRLEDLELLSETDPLFDKGTRIIFRESLVSRMRGAEGGAYIRFRLNLTGQAKEIFSSELAARDQAFVSSAGKLELTEFRLNERRSYPANIANIVGKQHFRITAVHYFLIRSLEHQLVSQHTQFSKVRRLEAPLWLQYLASAYGGKTDRLTAKVANRLIIYHWKEKEKPPQDGKEDLGIGDFIAFASFRTTSSHLLFYAFVIVVLGAAGSVLASFTTSRLALFLQPVSASGEPGLSLHMEAELFLLGVAILAILLLAYSASIIGWVKWLFSRFVESSPIVSMRRWFGGSQKPGNDVG